MSAGSFIHRMLEARRKHLGGLKIVCHSKVLILAWGIVAHFHDFACSLQGQYDLFVLNARDGALLHRFLRILTPLIIQLKVSLCFLRWESDDSMYFQSTPLAWPRMSQGLACVHLHFPLTIYE